MVSQNPIQCVLQINRDRLDHDMSGFKLDRPLKAPMVTKPEILPPRVRTPDLIEEPLPNAPTVAELGVQLPQ